MSFLEQGMRELFLEALVFVLAILLVVFLFGNNLLLIMVFLVIFLISVLFFRKKRDVIYFIAGAIIGTVGEIICIKFGVWYYSNPTFFGIPMWLPFAWGFTIVLIRRVSMTLRKINS